MKEEERGRKERKERTKGGRAEGKKDEVRRTLVRRYVPFVRPSNLTEFQQKAASSQSRQNCPFLHDGREGGRRGAKAVDEEPQAGDPAVHDVRGRAQDVDRPLLCDDGKGRRLPPPKFIFSLVHLVRLKEGGRGGGRG